MGAPKRNAVQRLGNFLRAPRYQRQEVKELRDFHRWVASVGGINSLEWLLMQREAMGLDVNASDDVAEYLLQLNHLTASAAVYQRELLVKAKTAKALSSEENHLRLCQRARDEDKRRAAMWDHLPPRQERKLTTSERMALAWERMQKAA